MPHQHDLALRGLGTRFRLFAQLPALEAYREAETVWISPRPGTIAPGPEDDRMYAVDAIAKPAPYEYPYLPPYRGATRPPAMPSAEGHFDHLDATHPAF